MRQYCCHCSLLVAAKNRMATPCNPMQGRWRTGRNPAADAIDTRNRIGRQQCPPTGTGISPAAKQETRPGRVLDELHHDQAGAIRPAANPAVRAVLHARWHWSPRHWLRPRPDGQAGCAHR
ncbi:hypothetical protein SAMN02745857_00364 [Andreprevotia lacus DSM 23236]|uniref:Uncharacterized protein n=1 Tax=Andreprevotia lacus DSM 23236 TaxID=1121001 RepID=A0A1W1WZZ7_9NEIS|nr:hypothetical protein SAMN02745857_00364 [Andreprevotia lacus DSM 23236]